MAKAKIAFLGTPEFAVPALDELIKAGYSLELVITQADKPFGRNGELKAPPVKEFAIKNGLRFEQPATLEDLSKIFKTNPFDVAILVAFGMLIPKAVLNLPKFGFVNLHPSLLPKYRGPSPIQAALLNGDETTGITIMKLDEKMDAGPIIAQQEYPIAVNETAPSLHQKLANAGAKLLLEVLPQYLNGMLEPIPQNDELASYCPIIKRTDGKINWHNSASQIFNQFRAFTPWPGIFTNWGGKRLKITNLSLYEPQSAVTLTPGSVFSDNGNLVVVCGQGFVKLANIQLEGKKELPATDFLVGHPNFEKALLS